MAFVNDHLGAADGNVHGASTWFHNVLRRIDRSQIDASLVIIGCEHPFEQEMVEIGYPPVFLRRGRYDPRALFDLIGYIRKHEIDVLHLSAMRGMFFGRIAARWTGARTVVHFHDTKRPHPLIGLLQRCVARWTDVAIGVSQDVTDTADRYFGISKERSIALLNAIDVSAFSSVSGDAAVAVRNEFGLGTDTPLITMIGRVVEQKGHTVLIEALKQVREACPEAVLLVVGTGPHMDACRAKVAAMGLGAHVHFAGRRRDIPALIAASDIVALPSLADEGCPMTCLESIAGGTPVVVTRDSGFNNVVTANQTGLIVAPGDADELAGALVRYFSDEALRGTLRAGCEVVRDQFDIGRYMKTLERIYQRLATGTDWRTELTSPSAAADSSWQPQVVEHVR